MATIEKIAEGVAIIGRSGSAYHPAVLMQITRQDGTVIKFWNVTCKCGCKNGRARFIKGETPNCGK